MGSLLGHALGLWSEGETLVGGHQASSSVAAFLATDQPNVVGLIRCRTDLARLQSINQSINISNVLTGLSRLGTQRVFWGFVSVSLGGLEHFK